ncbi:hypothetical protein HT031_002845 [Scenedesmus sp. PABB004]|nr:hypothetical protein HT031_002845 [Scenedesmus sp. PABB004]
MGGGGDSYHPKGHHTFKEVWSPSGGWWCDPKGWRRNTALAVGVYMVASYFIFSYSAENERRYTYPKNWVPSMLYAKHFPPKPEGAPE